MFFAILLAVGLVPHPLENIRLTQMQMFELQKGYRYHVQVVEVQFSEVRRSFEATIRDFYANDVQPIRISAPLDDRFPRGSVTHLWLRLGDVLTFPDDRYRHSDGYALIWDGEFILIITDRQEKKTVWPLKPPDP